MTEQFILGTISAFLPTSSRKRRNLLLRYTILSVLGVSFALLLAYWFAARLARPIHALAGAAQKMQHNESPEPVLAHRAGREIHLLVGAFNEMATALISRERSLKVANEKLESANSSLRSLNQSYMETVGFISHELKNPLGTMLNHLYLLREQQLGPLSESQRRTVEALDGNVRLLTEMVRHYLDLSRIENGTFSPDCRRVAVVDEVLAPLLASFEPDIKSRGMRLENGVSPQVELHADRNMTREVFENLLSNAVKYGREGGLIRLDAQQADGFVHC